MDALCAGVGGVCSEVSGAKGTCAASDGGQFELSCDYTEVEAWEADEALCDGVDNDCDGAIDEALTLVQGEEELGLGDACVGLGACQGERGYVMCAQGIVQCDATASAQAETCNGLDDDCDGAFDEAISEGLSAPEETLCLTEGVCALSEHELSCVSGEVLCAYVLEPTYESVELSCDALDNDCDGWTDEGTLKDFSTHVEHAVESQPVDRERWRLVEGDGDFYLFGGRHERPLADGGFSGRALGDLWRFEPEEGTWEALTPAPGPRAGHATTWAAALDGLLVHGGVSSFAIQGQDEVLNTSEDMWLWHAPTDSWHLVNQEVVGGDVSVLGRLEHSLTAHEDGRLILHGGQGLGPGSIQTWVGELSQDAEGLYHCSWTEALHQAPARWGHEARYDALGGGIVLVGGVMQAGASFATLLQDEVSMGWEPLGSVGKTKPSPRHGMAFAYSGGDMVLVGGAPLGSELSEGLSDSLADAWRYESATGTWTAFELPDGVPGLRGAFLLPTSEQTWTLGGGQSEAFVSWRQTWSLDTAELTWGENMLWRGIAPRTGATLVTEPLTERMWILGGARLPRAFPLMDVYEWSSNDESWLLVEPALAPLSGVLDLTRPRLSGALGAWSPVDQVVMLLGGIDLISGTHSQALWAFDPEPEVDGQHFSKVSTYGDIPEDVHPSVFVVDTSSSGWMVGRSMQGSDQVGASAEGKWRIYALDLTSYAWTLRWESASALDGLGQSARILGGTSASHLALMAISDTGEPSLWHFDAEANVLVEKAITGDSASISEVLTWVHDPQGHMLLLTGVSLSGPATWQLNMQTGELTSLASEPLWPGHLRGLAVGFSTLRGVVMNGGHDTSGYTTSLWSSAPQVCP